MLSATLTFSNLSLLLSPLARLYQVTSSRAAAQLAGTDSPSQSQRDSYAQQAHGSAFHMATEGGPAPTGTSMYYSCATLPAQVRIPGGISDTEPHLSSSRGFSQLFTAVNYCWNWCFSLLSLQWPLLWIGVIDCVVSRTERLTC